MRPNYIVGTLIIFYIRAHVELDSDCILINYFIALSRACSILRFSTTVFPCVALSLCHARNGHVILELPRIQKHRTCTVCDRCACTVIIAN